MLKNSLPREKTRILFVDDEQEILDTYLQVLSPLSKTETAAEEKLASLGAKLFGDASANDQTKDFNLYDYDIDFCRQGVHAVEAVRKSVTEKNPFAVAFIDMRMPPGMDGLWTAENIRQLDTDINIVIVTAYTDVDPFTIASRVLPADKFLYLQKPFHDQEIRQFVLTMSAKWQAGKKLIEANSLLEERVRERTEELLATNAALVEENSLRQRREDELKKAEEKLHQQNMDLDGLNNAISILYKKKEVERQEFEKKIQFNVNEMVEPLIQKLRLSELDDGQQSLVNMLDENLKEITKPFMSDMYYKYFMLSQKEILVANLIKQGKSSKEIAQVIKKSQKTVDFYRDKIRAKVGIKNKKANLKAVLQKLDLEFPDHS